MPNSLFRGGDRICQAAVKKKSLRLSTFNILYFCIVFTAVFYGLLILSQHHCGNRMSQGGGGSAKAFNKYSIYTVVAGSCRSHWIISTRARIQGALVSEGVNKFYKINWLTFAHGRLISD
jgi:hypothetical protein